ncbi:MAG: DUF1700 domain-containing protein [Clostridiales bacterium]|nr:DUF1700 domain-containing protein [Clostridiales bacterium]
MRKYQFLQELREGLSALQESEKLAACSFYSELIDDRMDEGMTEEEAVADMGDIAVLAAQVLAEGTPESAESAEDVAPVAVVAETAAVEEKPRKGMPQWLLWTLIIVGFPVWFSLLMALLSVAFSLLVSLWSVVISLVAVAFALPIAGAAALLATPQYGLAAAGAGICTIGLGLLAIVGVVYLVIYAAKATAWMFRAIPNAMIKREEKNK